MKNLEAYWQDYYTHTGRASDAARALALSAIAIIWVFAIQRDNGPILPKALLLPGALAVTSLALDLLQYAWLSFIWGKFARRQEKKKVSADAELAAPPWYNYPGTVCFWGKLGTVVTAYVFLLVYILRTLFT